jgi:selenocysteine-specific elongation factor
LPEGAAAEALKELLSEAKVLVLGQAVKETRGQGEQQTASDLPVSLAHLLLVSAKAWPALVDKLTTALRGYHRRYPLRAGMPREELRSRLKLRGDALEAVLATAVAQGHAALHESSVAMPEFTPALAADQANIVRRLLEAYRAAPYSPPAPDVEPELLGWLLEQGQIIRVAPDVAFLPQTYAEMIEWVRAQIGASGSLTVAQFRDRFGSSRKYALALLEHLDERKITRRQGDARVLY